MKYLIVIETTPTGYSAYSPDLPGCISTGHTYAEVESNMHEAIEFHLEGFARRRLPDSRTQFGLSLRRNRGLNSQTKAKS